MLISLLKFLKKINNIGRLPGRVRIPIKNVYEWGELGQYLVFIYRGRGISEFQTFLADTTNE